MIGVVAVTPTFPSRETLDRLRFRPLDVVVGIAVLLLIYAVVRVGAGARAPAHQSATISLDPSNLPYYAARSLLRMFIALFFAYAFSFGYAYVAARSRRWRRVLIPALDILQSVPVLGFLAITVTLFVALFVFFPTRILINPPSYPNVWPYLTPLPPAGMMWSCTRETG